MNSYEIYTNSICVVLSLWITSCKSKTEENTSSSDTTAITPPTDGASQTPRVDTIAPLPDSTRITDTTINNKSDINSSDNVNRVTKNDGGERKNVTTHAKTNGQGANNNITAGGRDHSSVAKSGEYNSDVRTPKPPNLDDKYLKKHHPGHTYGDTASHDGGLQGTGVR